MQELAVTILCVVIELHLAVIIRTCCETHTEFRLCRTASSFLFTIPCACQNKTH